MIIKLTSSLPSFKTLDFKGGLNILLAEKHDTSGVKDTRNGTGKTSFIELVHYLLAEKSNKKDDFHKSELVGTEFNATFSDNGIEYVISKKSGSTNDELKLDDQAINTSELREKLASEWFGLSKQVTSQKYTPKFGALLSYIIRKERNGGFASPALNSAKQKSWDSQVCLSYLMGFDWSLPQELQLVKDQKKDTDTLISMIKSGYLSDGAFDINQMQARLDFLDVEVEEKRKEVVSAKVVDGYRDHELTANELTANIRDLNEANIEDLELCENIDLALSEVEDANITDVKNLYEQVGVFFSDQVKKRFEQVSAFHAQVAKNRKTHLNKEKKNAQGRLLDRKKDIERLQRALAEKMALLGSGIAIERLTLLQSELNRLEAEQNDLRQQIPRFRNVVADQKRLKGKIDDLVDLIDQDVIGREEPRKTAVNIFAEASKFLYDKPGKLIIGRSPGISGLSVETDIIGKKSGGKNHMQVFCFDWVLVEAALRQDIFPGFLIHDSHIFDGVDGRQIGLALQLAHEKCKNLNVQYIVAMNSDDLEKAEFEPDENGELFDPTPFILKTRLTDEPNGGLFGIRF